MFTNALQNIISDLPYILLSIPAVLISLSVHESAHGLVANWLGDPTARNLGRITLNPMKHFDLMGFLCMIFFRIGWANPVPINTRYFKKPRRDMALSAAAGPLSNLILAILFTGLLRILMLFFNFDTLNAFAFFEDGSIDFSSVLFKILAIFITMFYLGIQLNLGLMLFNLIPLPPLDGSRILYVFLPTKIYFGIMKYEKYIMIAFIALLYLGILSLPISTASSFIMIGLFKLFGINEGYLYSIIGILLNMFSL